MSNFKNTLNSSLCKDPCLFLVFHFNYRELICRALIWRFRWKRVLRASRENEGAVGPGRHFAGQATQSLDIGHAQVGFAFGKPFWMMLNASDSSNAKCWLSDRYDQSCNLASPFARAWTLAANKPGWLVWYSSSTMYRLLSGFRLLITIRGIRAALYYNLLGALLNERNEKPSIWRKSRALDCQSNSHLSLKLLEPLYLYDN